MPNVPTRFPKGVNNQASNNRFRMLQTLDPTKWVTYFNDFAGHDSLPTATDANYTVTKVGTGTVAQANGLGGWSLITNTAGATDSVFIQKLGSAFQWDKTKAMFFAARLKVSDATLSQVIVGLYIQDTTPLDATDGLFFYKNTGAATFNFVSSKGSAQDTLACGSFVTDTFKEVAFYYPGKLSQVGGVSYYQFEVWIDAVLQGYLNVAANVPDTQLISVGVGVQNGEAVAKTLTVDYIYAALER